MREAAGFTRLSGTRYAALGRSGVGAAALLALPERRSGSAADAPRASALLLLGAGRNLRAACATPGRRPARRAACSAACPRGAQAGFERPSTCCSAKMFAAGRRSDPRQRLATRKPDEEARRALSSVPLRTARLLLVLLIALLFGSSSPLQSAPLSARRRLETAPSSGDCASTFNVSSVSTTCTVDVPAGFKLVVGNIFLPGASCSGDTWLSLLWGDEQEEVARNDNFFSSAVPYSTCSLLSFTVPSDRAGTYTVSQGCDQSLSAEGGSCEGVVALLAAPAGTFSCGADDDPSVCAAFGDLFAAHESVFEFEPGWFSAQFGIPTEYCTFACVTCTDGVVTTLDFSAVSAFGDAFPDGVFNAFPELTDLVLAGKQFLGSFPPSLFGLTALTRLDLSFNQLEGSIPDGIESLSALEELLLVGNWQLNGSIPDSLGTLTRLTNLCVRALRARTTFCVR